MDATQVKTPDDRLVAYLQRELDSAWGEINKLADELKQNPLHALSWSFHKFEAAATIDINTYIIKWLNGAAEHQKTINDTAKEVETAFLRDIRSWARSGSHSTSPTSNLADEYKVKAQENVLRHLETYFRDYTRTKLEAETKFDWQPIGGQTPSSGAQVTVANITAVVSRKSAQSKFFTTTINGEMHLWLYNKQPHQYDGMDAAKAETQRRIISRLMNDD